MPQQVKCPNILRFDKEKQQYIYCGHVFSFDGSNSGEVVECPTCGGDVRLGGLDLSRGDTVVSGDIESVAEQAVDSEDFFIAAPLSSSGVKKAAASGDATIPLEPPAEPPALPGPQPSFHGTNLQMASYCPSCGVPLPADQVLCEHCGFHRKLQRRIRSGKSAPDQQHQLRGFQLWLNNNLAEGESIQGLLLMVGAFILLLLVISAVVTFVAYGLWGALFLPPLLLLILLMLHVAAMGDSTRSDGIAGLVQRLLWSSLLRFYRLTRWKLTVWPPGAARIWANHDANFGNDALLEVSELDQCQVIDLEGTGISDEGLTYLTAFPQLRFIVLRKTDTSDEAVDRLQSTLPAAWIWH